MMRFSSGKSASSRESHGDQELSRVHKVITQPFPHRGVITALFGHERTKGSSPRTSPRAKVMVIKSFRADTKSSGASRR
jgi:hypothetical protein